jgi:FeS assembly SUF system protein
MDVKPLVFLNRPQPAGDADAPLRERVIAAIRTVYDPEMSVNVYDLGLIYAIEISDGSEVLIDMTLTAPGCPVAGLLPRQVEAAVAALPDVCGARVQMVWDPPWSRDSISEEAKLTLGLL